MSRVNTKSLADVINEMGWSHVQVSVVADDDGWPDNPVGSIDPPQRQDYIVENFNSIMDAVSKGRMAVIVENQKIKTEYPSHQNVRILVEYLRVGKK